MKEFERWKFLIDQNFKIEPRLTKWKSQIGSSSNVFPPKKAKYQKTSTSPFIKQNNPINQFKSFRSFSFISKVAIVQEKSKFFHNTCIQKRYYIFSNWIEFLTGSLGKPFQTRFILLFVWVKFKLLRDPSRVFISTFVKTNGDSPIHSNSFDFWHEWGD